MTCSPGSRSNRGRSAARLQHGVAAIEFALVFSLLFLLLYVIATFGAVLYTQQAVSRAAEDGARSVALQPVSAQLQQNIVDAVRDSLAEALVVPALQSSSTALRRAWIANNVNVTVTLSGNPNPQAVVLVKYPYSANRLLPTLPLLDTSRWMPDNLSSRATAAIPS